MRVYCTLFILFLGYSYSLGQVKDPKFSLPSGNAEYSSGYVLVKLKSVNRDLFQGTRSGRVAPILPAVTGAKHLIDETLLFKGRTVNGPRISQSMVDMSLYYEVACTPGTNIEDFINQLYETDYFEVVEPAYVHRLFLTPNDPFASQQYYLQNINAPAAWDINQGSEAITIAIVDTGAEFSHPDLRDNLYSNPNDPDDGINNDGDGYFDDHQGWDFVGADTLNINNPNFIGDNNPGLTQGGSLAHGVSVAGCASARTNNGIGIAGVGFKTKLMFTKHTADNQKQNRVTVTRGYSGILYAASKGAKIINCSWGGPSKSQIEQDLINYVTNDLGSLVVAAAGNNGSSDPFYPAAYDNVLSVSATDKNNVRASFTNIGGTIDIAAPGVEIYTTTAGGAYTTINGSSFSSPIVAGAAALVLAANPTFTPQQISEQLRVSSNYAELYGKNPNFINLLGRGLLDIQNALTLSTPSLRGLNPKLLSASGLVAEPGQKGYLTLAIKNNLKTTSAGVEIKITSFTESVTVTKGIFKPGIIGSGQTITNKLSPFEVNIKSTTPENTIAVILIDYTDGAYHDSEVFNFFINPSFIDVNENLIATTVSSTGRIGYEDPESTTRVKGSGFNFNTNSMIFEMGLIMGTPTALYNNVRGNTGTYDKDFVSLSKIRQILPGERSTSEIFGSFSNSVTPTEQAVSVNYRSLVWKEAPYEKFVILEYKISNPTQQDIVNFHFGIFSDWDITASGSADAANWDNLNKMGYVYPATAAAKPYGGIQLLTGSPEYFAIDNNQQVAGNPFGLYDGFTDAEKFQSISSGLSGKLTAGLSTPNGGDVSHVVSSGPYNIPAGQEIKIAFALHAALNLNELKTSARYADSVYNYTLAAVKPMVPEVKICYDNPATVNASGATKMNWYKTFTGGTPFATGSQFTTSNLLRDTVFYISNAEKTYESVRTAAVISVKANPRISTSGSPSFCTGESITLSVADADTYLWSTGAITKTIDVSAAGAYSVAVTDAALNCLSNSPVVNVTVNPNPVSNFVISTGGELKSNIPIGFTNQSTGAITSLWDFGDGQTSADQNPSHTFSSGNNYTVKLIVYSDKGCQHVSTKSVAVITGIKETGITPFESYPNPFTNSLYLSIPNEKQGTISARVIDMLGNVMHEAEGGLGQPLTLFEFPSSNLSPGFYIVQIKIDNKLLTQKVVRGR